MSSLNSQSFITDGTLPPNCKPVLVSVKGRVLRAMYVYARTERADVFYDLDGHWDAVFDYDADADTHYVKPGWFECSYYMDDYEAIQIPDPVDGWMPLPDPLPAGGTA